MMLVGDVGTGGGTIVRNVRARWLEDGRLEVMVRRCLVIIAGRERVLCLAVMVVDGEDSGGWTGGACLVIVVLVPCYRSCLATVVDDEEAGLGREAPRSLIAVVGEGAKWCLGTVVYGDCGSTGSGCAP